MLRNMGKSHTTTFGKQVTDPCRIKCSERIDVKYCVKCFKDYWSLANRDRRVLYDSRLVAISPKKRHRTRNPLNKRLYSCIYKLIITGKDILMCQKCFLKTLGEKISLVKTVLERKKISRLIFSDEKVYKAPPNNRITHNISKSRNTNLSATKVG